MFYEGKLGRHQPIHDNFKYTVLHMFTQVLFWAGNQDNHQKGLGIKWHEEHFGIFLGSQ
jgi:hypothetical protein